LKIFRVLYQVLWDSFQFVRKEFDIYFWKYSAKKENRKVDLISLFNNHVLIDIGASYFSPRSWTLALASPRNRLIAVDPNGSNLDYLEKSEGCEVKIIRDAIGAKSGTRKFYRTHVDSGSSFYKPRITEELKLKINYELESYLFPYEESEIRTVTLVDAIGGLRPEELLWFKLDTQGSELEILKSVKNLLSNGQTTVVELEVTLLSDPIMEGSGSLIEVLLYMEECGFELLKLTPIYSENLTIPRDLYFQRGYLNECDVIFTRKLTSFCNWKIEEKISMFLAYLSYGFVDLGFRLALRDESLHSFLSERNFNFENLEKIIKQIQSIT
jgi:FkbM family methyltransferase